ncbi:unnamed protein product [Amoebophrya sp. A120]|nr:unnamed protein product [Amoebophrya sp. A120]|eukprot:GSA120T00001545001.1
MRYVRQHDVCKRFGRSGRGPPFGKPTSSWRSITSVATSRNTKDAAPSNDETILQRQKEETDAPSTTSYRSSRTSHDREDRFFHALRSDGEGIPSFEPLFRRIFKSDSCDGGEKYHTSSTARSRALSGILMRFRRKNSTTGAAFADWLLSSEGNATLDELGLKLDEFHTVDMMQIYRNSGRTADAYDLFEKTSLQFETPSVVACTVALSCCPTVERILQLLDKLPHLQENPRSITAAITTCGQFRDWRTAVRIFDRSGLLAGEDVHAFAATISVCAQMGRWEEAVRILEDYKKSEHQSGGLSVVTWTTNLCRLYGGCISACRRAGKWDEALRLLDQAEKVYDELKESSAGQFGVTQAEGSVTTFQQDPYIVTSVRDVDAGQEQEDDLWKTLLVCYTACMNTCERAGRWRDALDVFRRLKTRGAPDPMAYASAVGSCQRVGAWREAVDLLDQMKRARTSSRRCSNKTGTTSAARSLLIATASAIEACAKAGQWQKALNLLPEEGEMIDDACVAAALRACESGGLCDSVVGLLERLEKPNIRVLNAALRACAARAAPEATRAVWQRVLKFWASSDVQPDVATYREAANAFERFGELKQVARLLSQAKALMGRFGGDLSLERDFINTLHVVPLLGRFRIHAPEIVAQSCKLIDDETKDQKAWDQGSPLIFSNFCWGVHLLRLRAAHESEKNSGIMRRESENSPAGEWSLDRLQDGVYRIWRRVGLHAAWKSSEKNTEERQHATTTIGDWIRIFDSLTSASARSEHWHTLDKDAHRIFDPVVRAVEHVLNTGDATLLGKLAAKQSFQSLGAYGTEFVLRKMGMLLAVDREKAVFDRKAENQNYSEGPFFYRPPRAADITAELSWELTVKKQAGTAEEGEIEPEERRLSGSCRVGCDADHATGHSCRTSWPHTIRGYRSRDANASHAEITAIRRLLQELESHEEAAGRKDASPATSEDGALPAITTVPSGRVRLHVSHYPCISCVGALCQFQHRFPKIDLQISWDNAWTDFNVARTNEHEG